MTAAEAGAGRSRAQAIRSVVIPPRYPAARRGCRQLTAERSGSRASSVWSWGRNGVSNVMRGRGRARSKATLRRWTTLRTLFQFTPTWWAIRVSDQCSA
jgi:hypothetical protein